MALLLAAAALLAALLPGCVAVYHPLSRLHRPVAIDTDVANFADVELDLLCLPGPVLSRGEAEVLCRRLTRVFENQGAVVHARTRAGRPEDVEGGQEPGAPGAGGARSRLQMQLSARLLHREKSWLLPWVTTEYSFAQDVVIRDHGGFLLVRDTLTGRITKRLGFFGSAPAELSRDLYGQLSQLTYNARMRRKVLDEATSRRAP